MKDPHKIIICPIITEKYTKLHDEENKVAFKVHMKANKIEIQKAISELFKVQVLKVNICKVKGKRKRLGRYEGKRSDWKKAVVTLAEGSKIDFFEGM